MMKRNFRALYRIFRQVSPPWQAVRIAWVLSGE